MEDAAAAGGQAAGTVRTASPRVRVVGRDGLERLWPAWDELAGSPLQSRAWLRAWLGTLGAGHEVCAVAVGDRDAPDAVAPLAAAPGPLRRLELMSVVDLFEPVGVLARDAAAAAELGAALRRLGRPLILRRVPAGSPLLDALAAGPGLARVRPGPAYPRIPLDGDWSDPAALLRASRRNDVRRTRRRAEALGEVSFEHHAPGEDAVGGLLQTCMAVEAAGWKRRSGTALALDARLRSFYEAYCLQAARDGVLRVALMRIGGRPVAMQLNVEWGGRMWGLKTGYDERAARAAPGILLTLESLRWSAARGLASFELLGVVEGHKTLWPHELCELVTAAVYPASPRGAAAAGADALELLRRRLRRP